MHLCELRTRYTVEAVFRVIHALLLVMHYVPSSSLPCTVCCKSIAHGRPIRFERHWSGDSTTGHTSEAGSDPGCGPWLGLRTRVSQTVLTRRPAILLCVRYFCNRLYICTNGIRSHDARKTYKRTLSTLSMLGDLVSAVHWYVFSRYKAEGLMPAPHGCVFSCVALRSSRCFHVYAWTHRDGTQCNAWKRIRVGWGLYS